MMMTKGRVVYFGRRQGAAIEYALASWPHNGKDGMLANEAEWLVDLITKADRDGKAATFADTYAASPLAAKNQERLEALLADTTPLPHHVVAELAVQHTTVTPFWWGLKTIVKYRTPKNYRDGEFLGPRIGDKFFMVRSAGGVCALARSPLLTPRRLSSCGRSTGNWAGTLRRITM